MRQVFPFFIICCTPLITALRVPSPTSESTNGVEAVYTGSTSAVKEIITIWAELKPRNKPAPPANAWCIPCIQCSINCGQPPERRPALETMRRNKRTMSKRTLITSFPELTSLPWTVTQREPARTIVIGTEATNTVAAYRTAAGFSESTEEVPNGEDNRAAANNESTPTDASRQVLDQSYAFALSGFHPGILPLIIANPGQNNSAVTLLAHVNMNLFSSFISLSLVDDLKLSGSVMRSPYDSPYLPERDMTSLLGYPAQTIGRLSLQLMTGAHNRFIKNATFTVIDDAIGNAEDVSTGKPRADLLVGWEFLNLAQAVALTDEYTGSREAGAKDGVPILVQKEFGLDGNGGIGKWRCVNC